MPPRWLATLQQAHRCFQCRLWLLLCASVLLATQALAGERALDTSRMDNRPVSLTEYFAVLEDPGKALGVQDVQRPGVASRFTGGTASGESLNISYTASAIWLRLHLQNTSAAPLVRMLEIANPLLAELTLYQPVDGRGYQALETGYALPFAARPHASRFFVLPIALPAHADQALYLRVATPNAMILPAKLWEPQAFHAHERSDYVFQALYFGAALAIILYNLMLFVALRDTSYLLYVVSAAFSALTVAAFVGVGTEYIWGDRPQITMLATNVSLAIALTAFLLFTRRMLFTAERVPRLDQLLKLFVLVNIAFCGLLVLWFGHFARLFVINYALTAVLLLVTGTVCAFKRERSAYYFMAAFVVVLLALAMLSMRQLGILPTNALTTSGAQIGSALEMLLLSFALADRYNVIRREKEAAQQRLVENLRTSEANLEERVAERTQALQVLNQRLEALSTTDGLTGIANRRQFDKLLANEWLRCTRLAQPLALAMVDIDWFKKYNDCYGHQAGDECLRNFSRILAATVCRSGDMVARYGGEEFVFFAPATDAEGALNMAQKVCEELQAAALPHAFSIFGIVTASIGVAVMVPREGQDPSALIQAADASLYLAKTQGRNRAVLAAMVA
ncbi:GGDEF domain-containing protein [Rhodoferax sp. AJA081-3]|uniref:diguanylate cyclase n=1 Tax=Rhodoferax sp. AJA081-3 TaxID=2752316 RepID=UPI001ADF4ABC|nr:diguanylate cyclase [Rhodoferax sp. AJA081-3]QTN28520.1 GGDEF domain-containing protein [Rhodoferax sp. AJA081-3]